MKKKFAVLLAAVLLLTGCAGETGGRFAASSEPASGSQQEEKQPTPEQEAEPEESAIPGRWTVPDGWVVAEQYSSKDKIFYVEEGHEDDELPDNISIEVGKNRYSADDHEQFRDAIVRQLMMQLQGMDAELIGDGTFTEQDYILYIFTITEPDVVTKQYYIVGDQRYCLIHLTDFTGSDSAAATAQAIADSFIWED